MSRLSRHVQPKRIAIIIPLYKQSVLLFDAIKSILLQNGVVPYDIIIIDDGCPYEQSVVAGAGLANNFDNVYYIRQGNRGLSGARNRGIEFTLKHLPECDAIFPLDSDNFLLPFSLNSFRRVLDAFPDYDWFYPDINYVGVEFNGDFSGVFSPALQTTRNVCEAGSLIRRRVFEAGLRFDESMKLGFEDWDFWLSAVERGFRGRHFPKSGFRYRKRPESMLAHATRKKAEIHAHMERKHAWMRDPATIVGLEHIDAPRFAILLVDRQIVYLTSDPCQKGEELTVSEFQSRFWASFARPNAHNVGAFLVVTTAAAIRWLDDWKLLRWVFWDLEVRLGNANFSTVHVDTHREQSLSTTLIDDRPQCDAIIALTSIRLIRDVCADREESWITSLPNEIKDRRVNVRHVFVPLESYSNLVDRQMLSWLVRMCLNLRAYPFDRVFNSCAYGWALGTPDRSTIPMLLRSSFDDTILPPIVEKRANRVAFVLPFFEFGGVEKVAYFVARALRKRGYRPAVVLLGTQTMRLPDNENSVFDEVYIIDYPGFKNWTGPDYQGTHLSSWSASDDRAGITNLLSSFEVVISCHSSEFSTPWACFGSAGL